MSSNANDVSPEHFEWLVECRSRNQRTTLDLYKLIDKFEIELNRDVRLQAIAQALVGVAFSLWRAVFLSDLTEEAERQLADVKRFLISLIADNTVLYQTDKNSRNWSFRYYLDNATYRLETITRLQPRILPKAALRYVVDSEKDSWLNAQAALDVAVKRFGEFLNQAR